MPVLETTATAYDGSTSLSHIKQFRETQPSGISRIGAPVSPLHCEGEGGGGRAHG